MSDRQRAEQASKDSERSIIPLVETLPLHILRKDLQGDCVSQPALCSDVGKSLKKSPGKTDFDLFPSAVAENHAEQQDQRRDRGRRYGMKPWRNCASQAELNRFRANDQDAGLRRAGHGASGFWESIGT